MKIDVKQIRRHGIAIVLGGGCTAIEGVDGGLPTLRIRHNGREKKFYRGSSLIFGSKLSDEDKQYLASLAADVQP